MEKGEGCQTAKSRSAADDRRRQEAVAQRREEEAKRRRLVAHGLSRQRHKRRIVFASDSDSDGGQGQQKKPATKQMADFIGEGRRTEEIDDENEEEPGDSPPVKDEPDEKEAADQRFTMGPIFQEESSSSDDNGDSPSTSEEDESSSDENVEIDDEEGKASIDFGADYSASGRASAPPATISRPSFSRFDPDNPAHMAWLRQEQATQKPSTEKANKKKEKIKRLQEDEIKSEEGTKSEEKGGDEEHSQRRLIGLAPDFADELRKTLAIKNRRQQQKYLVEVDNTEMTVEKGFSFLTAIGREPADFVEEDEEGQSSFVVASAAGRSAVESGRPLQTNGQPFDAPLAITDEMLFGREPLPQVVLAECGREKEGSSLVRSLAATFRLHLHTDQEDKVALAKKHWTHRRDQFVKFYKRELHLVRQRKAAGVPAGGGGDEQGQQNGREQPEASQSQTQMGFRQRRQQWTNNNKRGTRYKH